MNELDVDLDTMELPRPAATLRRSGRGGMRIATRDVGTGLRSARRGPSRRADLTVARESRGGPYAALYRIQAAAYR